MSKKALVVEDDVNIAELLMLYLEKDGFEVSIAHDGGRGIEMFNETSPDLVLLDVMMPVMDGMQVCREIRKTSSVPIIMLTAKGAVGDKVAGLDIGADDYKTDRVRGEETAERAEVDHPLEIVIEGVLQAAPLAVLCDAAALVKAFSLVCHHILPPWSFFISMLSTKAWNLVRSWPADAIVYSFSTPMQGMPSTSFMSCTPMTRS